MTEFSQILAVTLMWLFLVNVSESDPKIDELGNSSNLIEYEYRYSVDASSDEGPIMDRWEQRIGEYVKGAYSVVEPDGRIRTVDYEVDGVKGYHAVVRMNEPGPQLLSLQQLSKANEIFPAPALPEPTFNPKLQTRNARNDGTFVNYHSRSPYSNGVKSDQRDHREAATIQIPRAVPPTPNDLPLSPANFNVPQTTNLIHFIKPAGEITGKATSGELFLGGRRLPADPSVNYNLRRARNSKLVRRFDSLNR